MVLPSPFSDPHERRRFILQGQDNFPIRFERGAQRKFAGHFCDRDRTGLAERDIRVFREHREEGYKIFRLHLQERWRLAIRHSFNSLNNRRVRGREGIRPSLGQGIQWTPSSPPFRFKHHHHFAAGDGLIEVRGENDEELGRLTSHITQQRGRLPARGCCPRHPGQ